MSYLGFITASLFLEKKNGALIIFVSISKTFKESPLLSIFCHLKPTGAKACKELQLYEAAIKWCCDGLAVSFTSVIIKYFIFFFSLLLTFFRLRRLLHYNTMYIKCYIIVNSYGYYRALKCSVIAITLY